MYMSGLFVMYFGIILKRNNPTHNLRDSYEIDITFFFF